LNKFNAITTRKTIISLFLATVILGAVGFFEISFPLFAADGEP
jgi:hypothetical protein